MTQIVEGVFLKGIHHAANLFCVHLAALQGQVHKAKTGIFLDAVYDPSLLL